MVNNLEPFTDLYDFLLSLVLICFHTVYVVTVYVIFCIDFIFSSSMKDI